MTNLLMSVITALIMTESEGNDSAKGDYRDGTAQAVGCLQIWPGVVDDVNRISGKKYKLSDRLSRTKSIEMAKIYLSHYCNTKRLGRTPTAEDYARCWNGGPKYYKRTGLTKNNLDSYWTKVKKQLQPA